MRRFPVSLAMAALSCGAACLLPPAAGETPNILLIVSEDNGPELGSYGDPFVKTPQLDALAAGGVRFERAYVAQAGCSQSRAAYLTGLYPHQNGQIGLATWKFRLYREDTPNIVRSLKKAGYRTGIIGKLHVNPESAFPFDFVRIHGSNFKRENLAEYAEAAAGFINGSARPFFLSVNYPDAHRPFIRQMEGMPSQPLDAGDVKTLAYIGLETPTLRKNTANYYNCMSRLDSLVGDLLATLRESGKYENTLIAYLGDHGADLLRGKRTSYEGGVKAPLIIRWPGQMKPGQARDELVSTLDLAPTFLEAAGAEPIAGLPGRSLAPLIAGEEIEWRRYLFTEFHLHSPHNYFPQRTVRNHRYKLIRNLMPGQVNPGYAFTVNRFFSEDDFDDVLRRAPATIRRAYERMRRPPEFELYDLERDPFEFHNLAGDPDRGEVLRELKNELHSWRRRTADPFLDPGNVQRLKAEIEATARDGSYQKPEGWDCTDYLAPHAPGSAAALPAETGKPNFVFILIDDLGWTDLGCYGSAYYETPNIDRLAREGLRFTDAYAACHSCSPTRASILTGRYPARTHVTDWIPGRTPPGSKLNIPNWTNFLRRAEVTIAEALKPAGYVSASIGKWHLGQQGFWPEDQGFDVSFGGSHIGSHSSMFPPYWPEIRRKELGFPGIPDHDPGEYLTDRLTREAGAFLEGNRSRPFFLYLSHYAVHTRIQAKPEVVERYKNKQPSGHHRNPEYAAMVEGVDQSVGQILARLEELNLTERTVVVFFSDNGGLSKDGRITSNFPLRGEKSSMWEGGLRVPLIIKWPGVTRAGSVSNEPVTSVDLFPTLLEIAQVRPDSSTVIDGNSLAPLLRGEAGFRRGPLYWHSPHYNAHTPIITTTPYGAVRDGDFKLIEFYEDNHLELYNLKEDIGETKDLAARMPEKARELTKMLGEWRDSVGAQMPTPNPDYDPVKYREYKEKRLWKSVGPYQQHTSFPTQ